MGDERKYHKESVGITALPVKNILYLSTGDFDGIALLPNTDLHSRGLTLRHYPTIMVNDDGRLFHTGPSPLGDNAAWELGRELPDYKDQLPPGTYLLFNHAVRYNFRSTWGISPFPIGSGGMVDVFFAINPESLRIG